jgi:hypothetical protein
VLAALVHDGAEQVHGVGVAGVVAEQVPAQTLGIRQVAGAVRLEGQRENLGGGRHSWAPVDDEGAFIVARAVVKGSTDLGQVSWKVQVADRAKPGIYEVSANIQGARASVDVPVRQNPAGILFSGQ